MTQLASQNLQTEVLQRDIDSAAIELYILDARPCGGTVYYFTPNIIGSVGNNAVVFQGNEYFPLPIASDGWEVNSDGSQPQPTLTVSNVIKTIQSAVISLGDLVGAIVTRTKTFAKYLDGGSAADPYATFPVDKCIIAQKKSHDHTSITWQLQTVIDRFGIKLPRRQILTNGDSRYGSFPGVGLYKV